MKYPVGTKLEYELAPGDYIVGQVLGHEDNYIMVQWSNGYKSLNNEYWLDTRCVVLKENKNEN